MSFRLGLCTCCSEASMRHRSPGRISSSSSRVEALFALSWILAGIGMHCLTTGAIWSMERDTVA